MSMHEHYSPWCLRLIRLILIKCFVLQAGLQSIRVAVDFQAKVQRIRRLEAHFHVFCADPSSGDGTTPYFSFRVVFHFYAGYRADALTGIDVRERDFLHRAWKWVPRTWLKKRLIRIFFNPEGEGISYGTNQSPKLGSTKPMSLMPIKSH